MTYPDVPMDLQCDSACVETSPTFFAKERYTGVHMCVKGRAGGACEETDYFKLSHTFSSTATGTDDDKLFLTGIQRTGRDVGATASPGDDTTLLLPPTTFSPVALANRHLPGAESLMRHWRIAKVTDEFGREVNVTYGQPHPCLSPLPSPPQWDLNTKDCFPQMWGPEGTPPTFRAFNKYLVTKVEVKDTTGGSPAVVTDYLYGDQINVPVVGAPETWEPLRDQAQAAWHHDQDPYTAQASMSWSEWRGYQDVLVKQGATRTRYKLYRGMDDDLFQNPFPGGFRTVNLTSLDGTVTNTPDSNWLAGRVLDEMTLRPTVNTPEEGTVHTYQAVVTANVPCTPMPGCETTDIRDARWVGEVDTVVRRRNQDAGIVFKKQRTQTTYNGTSFVPETVAEHGWTDVAGDERCTRTDYVINASAHMLDYPQRVTRYDNGTACSGTAVTRTETAYDGGVVGAAPTEGNPTTSRVQTSAAPSPAGTWSTTGTEYDRFGRPRVVTDPDGYATTTVYNDASDDLGYPYNVKVTNHLGHVSETELFLVRQAPAWSDDANDKRTTFAYDPLGRVTSVWQPTETTTGPASWAFSYDIAPNRNEVPVIGTRQLQDTPGGTPRYLDSWVLYDSLLRERQTQTPSPTAGKVIVADTRYDDRGLVQYTNVPEAVTATPGNALAATPANGWRNSTQTAYDHVGRANWELFWADDTDPDLLANNAQRSTLTTFTHEAAVIDPLVGGNTRTTTDGLGRSTEVAEHDGTADRTTTYGYDKADRLLTVRDPANNTITYTYDLAGRRLTMNDPDAGNWSYGYDPAGNQTSVTDALSAVVHTVYDELNRPTERREDNPTTGDLLATWSYDSLGGAGAADDERGLLDRSTRVTPTGNWVVDVAGYDARNRPTGRTWTVPAGIPGLSGATPATFGPVTYGYDQADHPTTVNYSAIGGLPAETVTTSYDSLGLADTMTGAANYVSVSAYDDRARPSLFGFGTSPALAMGKFWAYDLNQQIQTMQTSGTGGGLTQSRTIAYDQAGNVTERNATLSGASAKECFGYDQRQRLTTAYTTTPATTCASGSNKGQGANPYNHAYSYTTDGNMLTRVEGGATTSYTYPAGGAGSTRPHAPTAVGTSTYTWNANGNQATRTIAGQLNTLTWDSEHRLAMVDDPDGDSSFTYAADGSRLLRRTPAGATLYIEGHEITAPTGGGPVAAVRSYGFAGQPVATRTPTGLDYLVTDNQGTLEQTIPAGSATAEHTRTYNPYGKLRTGGQPDTDHTWIGQIEDDSTALAYLNARYYDPTTGVFTATDPLGDLARPKTLNPYSYAINSPTTNSDPDGELAVPDGGYGYKSHPAPPPASRGVGRVSTGLATAFVDAVGENIDVLNPDPVKNEYCQAMGQPCGIDYAIDLYLSGEFTLEDLRKEPAYALLAGDAHDCFTGGDAWSSSCGWTLGDVLGGRVLKAFKHWDELAAIFRKADEAVAACSSFDGDTQVLMANGERVPISEVRVGDEVLATDPETGESGGRTVVTTLPHTDQLLALKTSAGDIITTEDHRYWNETDQQWQESQHLDEGDRLLTADGDVVTVEGLDWTTLHTDAAYDLDVADIDTFYVGTGDEEILVHNSGLDCLDLGLKVDANTGSQILDGPMPGRDAVRQLNPADRAELQELLDTSIVNRRADQVSGMFPTVDPRHTARIAEEESLLEFLQSLR